MNKETTEQELVQNLAPGDRLFLAAIQDEQKRAEVISILKSAGLLA